MHKTQHNTLKPNLRGLGLHYMDCHSFFISFKSKDKIKDLSKLGECFEFSNIDDNDKLFLKGECEK